MNKIFQILGVLFLSACVIFLYYCYLSEGYKGLFKGEMELKAAKGGGRFISGIYARIWGFVYLLIGLVITAVIIFLLAVIF